MSSSPKWIRALLVLGLSSALLAAQAQTKGLEISGLGRTATPKEIAAWDIDVRPDFKGLPKGAGSVAKGQEVWEGKCAHCHGIFGESGEVFSPLVGGTTPEDIKTGRVARLNDASFPGRTTLMKVPTVSTLWDYINRAMPWTQPKSLSTEEVYAVTAFLLNLGGIVPDEFVLTDGNMPEVQARMPNRNGMSLDHHLWPGRQLTSGKAADTSNKACMKDCPVETRVASDLPEHARNAHGNLAEQNRAVGSQHGARHQQTGRRGAGSRRACSANPCSRQRQARCSHGLVEQEQLHSLSRHGQQTGRPFVQGHYQEIPRQGRRRQLPHRQDSSWRQRGLGRHPDARADAQ